MKSSWRVWFLSSSWIISQIIGCSWGGKVRYLKLLGSLSSFSFSFIFPISNIYQDFIWPSLLFMALSPAEKCFISPQTSPDVGVLTIGGFYFLSLRRSNGQIQGFYYDPKSQPYQELKLRPQKRLFPTYEFRWLYLLCSIRALITASFICPIISCLFRNLTNFTVRRSLDYRGWRVLSCISNATHPPSSSPHDYTGWAVLCFYHFECFCSLAFLLQVDGGGFRAGSRIRWRFLFLFFSFGIWFIFSFQFIQNALRIRPLFTRHVCTVWLDPILLMLQYMTQLCPKVANKQTCN